MLIKRLLTALLLIPIIAACNANLQISVDENYTYVTFTMEEDDVENLIETLLTSGDSKLQNVNADLRDGGVFVTADARANNGTIHSGDLSVLISTQNGLLDVRVTSFNFAGYTAQEAGINDFNQRLADGIANNARNRDNGSEFTEVNVTPTGLTFTVRTPRPNR